MKTTTGKNGAFKSATLDLLLSGLTLSGLLLSAVACGASGTEAAAPPPAPLQPLTVEQVLPLVHDTVFSYVTSSDEGDEGLMVLQVRRPRPELVELDIAGRVQRVLVRKGAAERSTGGFLLREPLVAGATFTGAFGQVRIEALEATVKVPAGQFERCVVTIEESTRPPKRATSTYCDGVGLVSLVVEGAEGARLETVLKSHGPRVDLDGPKTTLADTD